MWAKIRAKPLPTKMQKVHFRLTCVAYFRLLCFKRSVIDHKGYVHVSE